MKDSIVPPILLDQIFNHALKEYPSECCGFLVGPEKDSSVLSRCIPCINVQDEYHGRDPDGFPRTSQNAYFVDPRQLLQVHKEIRAKGQALRIIYHSHPNSDVVFSDEDQKMAAPDGEPLYSGVAYLVVSVKNGKVHKARVFSWDSSQSKFV